MTQTHYTFRNLDAFMQSDLLADQDDKKAEKLMKCMMDEELSADKVAREIRLLLESIDWKKSQKAMAHLLSDILPFENLVPEVHKAWRPVVKEALIFLAGRLPPERLIPKLIEQIIKPDRPLELRFLQFITRMPTLQKLGQIIARNRNLEPHFRAQLIHLENSIRDVGAVEIQKIISGELGDKLKRFHVKPEEVIHSEASVSAVIRFTWINPSSLREEQGVFKVRKPGITKCFKSEMKILKSLAGHLSKNCPDSMLEAVDLAALFKEVNNHLKKELDPELEQQNLVAANNRFRNLPGIRIPKLIEELSTPRLTAMSFEEGQKVTEAYQVNAWRKSELTILLVEALIATPLYSSEEEAVFHADPHAGNLFVNEKNRELVILDWSLTENLTREERHNITRLVSALFLRDEQLIFDVLNELSVGRELENENQAEAVFKRIRSYVRDLHPLNLPSLNAVLQLLDEVTLTGIRFSTGLVIFRKMLLTLDGVLKDVGGHIPLESVLAHYAFKEWIRLCWGMNSLEMMKKPVTLSPMDSLTLFQSAQWFGLRTGLQTISRILGLR